MKARTTIYSTIELDNILANITIPHLIKNWGEPQAGIVAATLVDGDKIMTATSTRNGNNYIHAERNAFNKFVEKYDCKPSVNAAFVVTLSPCFKAMPDRAEESCTHLLLEKGIKRVHFGTVDEVHTENLTIFKMVSGLNASLTEKKDCLSTCTNLKNLLQYEDEVKNNLPRLKERHRESTFAPMNQASRAEPVKCRLFKKISRSMLTVRSLPFCRSRL